MGSNYSAKIHSVLIEFLPWTEVCIIRMISLLNRIFLAHTQTFCVEMNVQSASDGSSFLAEQVQEQIVVLKS